MRFLSQTQENIDSYNFALIKDDIAKIDTLNKNLRFVDPSNDWGFNYFAQ